MEPITSPKQIQKGLTHLLIGSAGIYISYITLAVYSQRLYSTTYQSNVQYNQDMTPISHAFSHPTIIVLISGLLCTIFGKFRSLLTSQLSNPIQFKQSLVLGFLYTINFTATNFAFLYISYPTQVISSNSRYLIIVIVGSFFSRLPSIDNLKLPKHKLYVAVLITLGVLIFNLNKIQQSPQNAKVYPQQWKGYILVFISIIAEALFCDNQAYNKSTTKPSANHLFTSANSCAFVIILIYCIVTGALIPGLEFIFQHPQCLKQLLFICVLQVTGQISIYYVVANFKQHIFPLVSATRKVITIVCSVLIFNHTLNYIQWIAVGVVFGGMVYEVYQQVSQKRKKEKKPQKLRVNPQQKQQKLL